MYRLFSGFRQFSYKPSQPITFENGKHPLLTIRSIQKAFRVFVVGTGAVSGLTLKGLLGTASWLRFGLYGAVFIPAGFSFANSVKISRILVQSISLLENGKEIEIQCMGPASKYVVDIATIKDPKEEEANQNPLLKESLMITTTTGKYFIIHRDYETHNTELLRKIFAGNDIDLEEKKDENIIDV